jgi:hypothetical protein
MHATTRLLIATVAGAILGACASTTTVDEIRLTTASISVDSAEKVVVLGRRDAGNYETDPNFVECVGGKINGANVAVVPENEFIDSLYPWFEPRTAPKGLAPLKKLMERPIVREKLGEARIRYLVLLDGDIESDGHAGSMSCTIGIGFGGCFGFTTWHKTAFFEAVVWDLKHLTEEARIRVDSEGTSYMIGVVAPIPLLTPVESEACEGMGNQLKSYFTSDAG